MASSRQQAGRYTRVRRKLEHELSLSSSSTSSLSALPSTQSIAGPNADGDNSSLRQRQPGHQEEFHDDHKRQRTSTNASQSRRRIRDAENRRKWGPVEGGNLVLLSHKKEEEKVFLLSQVFGRNSIFCFNKQPSLGVFSTRNPFRQFCMRLIVNPWFDNFILLTIFVNCILLALNRPPETPEYFFTAIYTSEMLAKIIALGFVMGKHSYLRSPWNRLDFIVVLLGYGSLAPRLGNVSAIRAFRVLRALRAITALPGLRLMVNSLLHALKEMIDVLLLMGFFLVITALFGLQLYGGTLRRKCVYTPSANISYNPKSIARNSSLWVYEDGKPIICGNVSFARKCVESVCLADAGSNPNYGYTNFDHFGWALLTSVQLSTLDFWEDVYNKVIAANGALPIIYFFFVIFMGSFYVLNLMLAVVVLSYKQERQSEEESSLLQMVPEMKRAIDEDLVWESKRKVRTLKAKKEKHKMQGDEPRLIRSTTSDTEQNSNQEVNSVSRTAAHQKEFVQVVVHSPSSSNSSSSPTSTSPTKTDSALESLPEKTTRVHQNGHALQIRQPRDLAPTHKGGAEAFENINEAAIRQTLTPIQQPPHLAANSRQPESGERSPSAAISALPSDKPVLPPIKTGNEVQGSHDNNACMTSVLPEMVFEDSPPKNVRSTAGEEERLETASSTPDVQNVESGRGDGSPPITKDFYACCAPLRIKGRHFLEMFYKHWQPVSQKTLPIVESPRFELIITLCIIINTIVLAIEHPFMPSGLELTLCAINVMFTFVFLFEMLLKLAALGGRGYFKVKWNLFDFIVVTVSLIEFIVLATNGICQSGQGGIATVFRGFRLLRILKLAQSWTTMKVLLEVIASSLNGLGYLSLILFIVIYTFALVGKQLFQDYYTKDQFDGEIPRWNFTDFAHSLMLIFRILCGEWIEALYDTMRVSSPAAALFYFIVLAVGNFLILNLFLALLLASFDDSTWQVLKGISNENTKKKSLWLEKLKGKCLFRSRRVAPSQSHTEQSMSINRQNSLSGDLKLTFRASTTLQTRGAASPTENVPLVTITSEDTANNSSEAHRGEGEEQSKDQMDRLELPHQSHRMLESLKGSSCSVNVSTATLVAEHVDSQQPCCCFTGHVHRCGWLWCICVLCCTQHIGRQHESTSPSLYSSLSSQWQTLRRKVKSAISHRYFDNLVLTLVLGSSISLAFDDSTVVEGSDRDNILNILNICFAVIFSIEMLLKWIGLGIRQYFHSPWNILDFIIVLVSVASLDYGNDNEVNQLSALRGIRTLRCLRPLRAISRWDGMRVVVKALLKSIPGIGNVLLVCAIFWLLFSIMGVQFFGGLFYKCVVNDTRLNNSLISNKKDCISNYSSAAWVNSDINYDNVINAALALFQVATFEGWIELMRDSVDATKLDHQPRYENNLWAYLFYVSFIIIGTFFVLNLFVGVIIDNFNRIKNESDQKATIAVFLTPQQQKWLKTMQSIAKKKPRRGATAPQNKMQKKFYNLVQSKAFELCIIAAIGLNTVVMTMQHYGQSNEFETALLILNTTFTVIFLIEAILKIIGLRLAYFHDPWNLFDFFVIIISVIGTTFDLFTTTSISLNPNILRVIRVLRLARFLRLVRKARGIRRLLFTLAYSLPALINIGGLLFLIIYIYSILGISLFGHVKHTGALNSEANFETFIDAFFLLFRLSTAAGWNENLAPCMIQPPYCDENFKNYSNGNCGYPIIAPIYFSTFVAITFLIIVNMYIAIILENFVEAVEIGVSGEDIKLFYEAWAQYDPTASQFMSWFLLAKFVREIPPPLGRPDADLSFVGKLEIPVLEGNRVHCLDVVTALVRLALHETLGDIGDSEAMEKVMKNVQRQFEETFPTRAAQRKISSSQEVAMATMTVRKAVRRFIQLRDTRRAAQELLMQTDQRKTSATEATRPGLTALIAVTANQMGCAVAVPESAQLLSSSRSSLSLFTAKADSQLHVRNNTLRSASAHSVSALSTKSKSNLLAPSQRGSLSNLSRQGSLLAVSANTSTVSINRLPSHDQQISIV